MDTTRLLIIVICFFFACFVLVIILIIRSPEYIENEDGILVPGNNSKKLKSIRGKDRNKEIRPGK